VWTDKEFLAAQQVEAGMHMPIWVPPGEAGYEGFAQVSAKKALDTGLTTRPISETVRDTLVWWREQPEERRKELRAGINLEREKGLIALWRQSSGAAKQARGHAHALRIASRWAPSAGAFLGMPA
jgi:2'-hydroxyisoflavone reductase